jgi:hypothetical protein
LLYRQARLLFGLKRRLQRWKKLRINIVKAAGPIEWGIPGHIAKRGEAQPDEMSRPCPMLRCLDEISSNPFSLLVGPH